MLFCCSLNTKTVEGIYNCETDGLTSKVEKDISNYILENQNLILNSIPRFQPLVEWIKTDTCIIEVFPPEAFEQTFPVFYDISLLIRQSRKNVWYKLRIQEGEIKQRFMLKSKFKEDAFLFRGLEPYEKNIFPFSSFVKMQVEIITGEKDGKKLLNPPFLLEEELVKFYKEEINFPKNRPIFMNLSPKNLIIDWLNAIEELKNNNATFHLCASLNHFSDEVKIKAIQSLRELKAKEAVPYLLRVAESYANQKKENKEESLYRIEIIKTLNEITGKKVSIDEYSIQKTLINGLKIWSAN